MKIDAELIISRQAKPAAEKRRSPPFPSLLSSLGVIPPGGDASQQTYQKIFLAKAIKFLKLSRATIDRYIARKAIPNYKVGRLRLFDRDELIKWVKSHRDNKAKEPAREKSKKKGGRK